jgi:hypothetical protein
VASFISERGSGKASGTPVGVASLARLLAFPTVFLMRNKTVKFKVTKYCLWLRVLEHVKVIMINPVLPG